MDTVKEKQNEKERLLNEGSILDKIREFGCIDSSTLYSTYRNMGNVTCIRNEVDFADYLMFLLPCDIRISNALKTRIIRTVGLSVNDTLEFTASKIVKSIEESGCVTQEDFLLEYPVFSELSLHGLLEKYTDEVVPTEINDFLCYQTIESMGLDKEFSSSLNDILREIGNLSLTPSQEIVHALLCVKIGYNLREEYSIPDDKTFRRIVSMYYTDDKPRVWKAGNYMEVKGENV